MDGGQGKSEQEHSATTAGWGVVQEQARLERLLEEDRATPFRPAINAYFGTQRPLLKLADPGPYLEHERARAVQRQQAARQLAQQQQVIATLRHMPKTFTPNSQRIKWQCLAGGQYQSEVCLAAEVA